MKQKEVNVGFNLSLVIVLSFFLLGCDNTELINTKYFSMVVPKNVAYHLKQDSKELQGNIIIEKDTVVYKFGLVGSLYEPEPNVIFVPNIKQFIKQVDKMTFDTTQDFLTENRFYDTDRYRKQQVYFRKIDNRFCKITYPNGAFGNKGMTGIYVDSIAIKGTCIWRFNLYGNNLSLANQKMLLESLSTIKFHNTEQIVPDCIVQ
jgi:hypothetical protein